jgi:hypothetical protein
MRCLAVRQPYAWAIVAGAKDIENRSWTTDYRGPVIIQASSSKTEVSKLAKAHKLATERFAFSALIGVADLVDVVPLSPELEPNPSAWGPHCWRFANARIFREPITAKGKLNLYTLAPDLAEKARNAIESAHRVEIDEAARQWLAATNEVSAIERRSGHLESYVAVNDGASALRLAEAALSESRTADALIDLGRARFIADDNGGALAAFAEAIALDGENARAFHTRAVVYEMLAEIDYARAAELDAAYADGAGAENEHASDGDAQ